jgi:hypothetical protein
MYKGMNYEPGELRKQYVGRQVVVTVMMSVSVQQITVTTQCVT